MESTESPLEVLSRAATMIQENQEALANAEESQKLAANSKHLPTTKWKRDRRTRLPEYSRKSDPKFYETMGVSTNDRPGSVSPDGERQFPNGFNGTESPGTASHVAIGGSEAPLDMSVRQRGLPPSYAQTISNPGFRSNYKMPSAANAGPPARDELPSGISMCDPIIDEHFRRSLGSDYHSVFSNNNVSKEVVSIKTTPVVTSSTNAIELTDNTAMSVDDHFAKALGDTWIKLNKKDIKNNTNDNHSLLST